jgi:hypothetical protein
MSTYQEMWDMVKSLSIDEMKRWKDDISPCKGTNIDFNGLRVVDVDLLEALNYMLEESSKR